MQGRHILAVAVGVVGDFVLSSALGLVLGFAMVIYYAAQGMPTRQITTQLDFAHLSGSVPFLLMSLGPGSLAPLISGFVAGWIARTSQVKVGLATGTISVLISVPFFFWYPLWYDVACVIVTIAFPTLGAYLALVTVGKRTTAEVATAS